MKISIIQRTETPGAHNVHTLEITPCRLTVADADEVFGWLWRQFNRVDGHEFISIFKLQMASLSVGDVAVFEDLNGARVQYVCSHFGWDLVASDKKPTPPKEDFWDSDAERARKQAILADWDPEERSP